MIRPVETWISITWSAVPTIYNSYFIGKYHKYQTSHLLIEEYLPKTIIAYTQKIQNQEMIPRLMFQKYQ